MRGHVIFKALICDFNGLILDDEGIHLELFQRVLIDEEITLSDKDYWETYVGYDDKGMFQVLFERDHKKLTPKKLKDLVQKKGELYLPTLKERIRFFPGVIDFIHQVEKKYVLAIVSGALKNEIDFALKEGKIDHSFELIVSAEETKHGKPDPEGLVIALTRLKKNHPEFTPQSCLVLEDSLAGIEAAHRAGMKCAALTHTYPREQLAVADYVIDSFEELKTILFNQ